MDLLTIMNLIKEAGTEKLKASNIPSDRVSRTGSSKKAATDTAPATEEIPKEIPAYVIAMLNILVINITEREDTKIQELRDEFEDKLAQKVIEFDTKLSEKDTIITNLTKKVRGNTFDLDAQAQYNRSENIKIHGIEYEKGEDTNKIVKDVAKYCGLAISDSDISVSHRLMSVEKMDAEINPANRDTKVTVIIARLNRRDLKTQFLECKKTITTNTECPRNLRKAMIYEDVTPLRSRIMFQLRHRNNKEAFRFVWSKAGRIYGRRHEQAAALPRDQQVKPFIINTPDDLTDAGFTKPE